MTNKKSTISTLAVAALLAIGASIALTQFGAKPGATGNKATAAVSAVQWTATAPGRVATAITHARTRLNQASGG